MQIMQIDPIERRRVNEEIRRVTSSISQWNEASFFLINMTRRDTKDCGISVGRIFRFIRESSSHRYFPRLHVPIPIGGVVNTVWPGIHPYYLIVSFHSKASSYFAAYTVILTLIRLFFFTPWSLRSWLETKDTNVVGISRNFSSEISDEPSLRILLFFSKL